MVSPVGTFPAASIGGGERTRPTLVLFTNTPFEPNTAKKYFRAFSAIAVDKFAKGYAADMSTP